MLRTANTLPFPPRTIANELAPRRRRRVLLLRRTLGRRALPARREPPERLRFFATVPPPLFGRMLAMYVDQLENPFGGFRFPPLRRLVVLRPFAARFPPLLRARFLLLAIVSPS